MTTMKVIRSFPEVIPPGRAYVQDDTERFYMGNYDYSGLKRFDEDIVLLEWDIAVSSNDLKRFIDHAAVNPEWPMVAPYKIGNPEHYAHWRYDWGLRPILNGEAYCDLFGFGLVYLPAWVIRDYPVGWGNSSIVSDGTLPRWLQSLPGAKPVPVDWSVNIVHLR